MTARTGPGWGVGAGSVDREAVRSVSFFLLGKKGLLIRPSSYEVLVSCGEKRAKSLRCWCRGGWFARFKSLEWMVDDARCRQTAVGQIKGAVYRCS